MINPMSDSDWSSSSYDGDDSNGSAEEEELGRLDPCEGAQRALHSGAEASHRASPLPNDDLPSPPLRQRKGQRASHLSSTNTSEAMAAYSEALRTTASHRESISTGASSGVQFLLPEETRRRHRDSKKRLEIAEKTQQLLLKAHELNAVAKDMPLWVHACVIPPRWRQQIMAHLTPIHEQMQFCQRHLLHAWNLLLPPFDRANFAEFEARFKLFERSIELFEAAIVDCQQRAINGEKTAASVFIQLWYRKQLTKVRCTRAWLESCQLRQ